MPELDPEMSEYLFGHHWSRPREHHEAAMSEVLGPLKKYAALLEKDIDLAVAEDRRVSVRYIAHHYGLVTQLVTELEMSMDEPGQGV